MRYIIAATCALAGVCAAAAEMIVCFVADPELIQSVVRKEVPGTAMMTGVCATFFAVMMLFSYVDLLRSTLRFNHHRGDQIARSQHVKASATEIGLLAHSSLGSVCLGYRLGSFCERTSVNDGWRVLIAPDGAKVVE